MVFLCCATECVVCVCVCVCMRMWSLRALKQSLGEQQECRRASNTGVNGVNGGGGFAFVGECARATQATLLTFACSMKETKSSVAFSGASIGDTKKTSRMGIGPHVQERECQMHQNRGNIGGREWKKSRVNKNAPLPKRWALEGDTVTHAQSGPFALFAFSPDFSQGVGIFLLFFFFFVFFFFFPYRMQ